MLVSFLPTFLERADIGPNGYRYPTWWFIARDIATVALIVISFLAFDFGIALALSIGFASALAYAFLFTGNFSCAVLLLGVISLTYSERAARYRWPIIAALALTLPSVFLAIKDGVTSGAVWVCCVGGAIGVALTVANSAFSARSRCAHLRQPPWRRSGCLALQTDTSSQARAGTPVSRRSRRRFGISGWRSDD
jgi:hypothetical protein